MSLALPSYSLNAQDELLRNFNRILDVFKSNGSSMKSFSIALPKQSASAKKLAQVAGKSN